MDAIDKYKIIGPYLAGELSLVEISSQHGIAIRSLRRWVKNYREHGMSALKRKPRSDKGIRYSIDESLEQIVKALALRKPKLSISTIHRKVIQIAEQQDKQIPKYNVIYDIVRKLDPALVSLALEGSVAYRDKYELIYRRESSWANEMWQADHTPLDILVLNEHGQSSKPWLSIIEDDYSRAISGYYLTFEHPSAINTALALRQAIWRKEKPQWQVCGIPQILYTDNGSDFISRHIEIVCASLKINLIHSIPGRPQGKGRVERFFLTLLRQFLEQLPGYAPGSSTKVKATLSLEELSAKLEDFIIDTYHQTPHSATKERPIDRWVGHGFLPQMPSSLDELDLLLLTVPKSRKVHRDGIRFKQFRYMNSTLAGFVGEQVTLRYDPRDLAEVKVYLEKEFICTAVCQEIAGQLVSLKEIKKARQARRRKLRKEINEAKELIQSLGKDKPENNSPTDSKSISRRKKGSSIKLYKNE